MQGQVLPQAQQATPVDEKSLFRPGLLGSPFSGIHFALPRRRNQACANRSANSYWA